MNKNVAITVGQIWRRKPAGFLYKIARPENINGYYALECITGGGKDTALTQWGIYRKFELVRHAE